MWTVVIALDFFWLSNPLVLWTFETSLRNACAVTLAATVLTPLRRGLRPPGSVVAVLGFGLLSAVWSNYSSVTLHFTLIYLAVAFVGLAITSTVDARTLAQGVALGGVVYVLLSVWAFRTGIPPAIMEVPEGEFLAGVGQNRNVFSYTVVLALPFALGFLPRTWLGRAAWAAVVAVLLWGVQLAQSDTGIVTAVVLCGLAAAMAWQDRIAARRIAQRRSGWTRQLALLAILAAALAALVRSGEYATFSGRTTFWSAIWGAVGGWDRWFGAGWGVVWPHPWYPAAPNALHAEIVERAGDFVAHGHSSFFDLLPEVGLIGSAVFATTYVQAAGRALALRKPDARRHESLEVSRIAVLAFIALVLFGITEPMSTIPLGWFLIVMLAAGIAPRAGTTPPPDSARESARAEHTHEPGESCRHVS